MARIAALMERHSTDRRESREARNDQGRDFSPLGDVLMERMLEITNTTAPEEVLRKSAPLVDIRRDKVLNIRRQIAEGTYEVAGRLDKVIERLLEAITP